jgi:hypothetical protein
MLVTQLLACKPLPIHKRSETKPLSDTQGIKVFAHTQADCRLPIAKRLPILKSIADTLILKPISPQVAQASSIIPANLVCCFLL